MKNTYLNIKVINCDDYTCTSWRYYIHSTISFDELTVLRTDCIYFFLKWYILWYIYCT